MFAQAQKVAAMLLLFAVNTATAAAAGLDLNGQAVTGHDVVYKGKSAYVAQLHLTKGVPGGNKLLTVAISNQNLGVDDREVAGAFWHGDNDAEYFTRKFCSKGYSHAKRVYWSSHKRPTDQDADPGIVSFCRPHNVSDSTRLSKDEVDTQMAALLYISRVWKVKKFNLAGHAGGASIAIEAARRLPREMVARVVLASPRLVVKYGQSPYNHVSKMPKDIPIFLVHDPRDVIVDYESEVLPYLKAARELGLKIRYTEVRTNDYPHHHTQWRLGKHLRKPENSDFRPQRRW